MAVAVFITEAEATSAVKSILNGIYGGANSEFAPPLDFVSKRVASILTKEGKTERDAQRLRYDVLNVIWNNYAGGDTAETATNRIFTALDIAA